MLKTLIFLSIIGITVADDPVVQTIHGSVLGETLKTFNGDNFFSFQGIPFAAPPVDELRFQPPLPAKDWEGVLDSRNAKKKCIQGLPILLDGESEDCLYLNVYTPQLPNEHKNVSLPVMVYIHGGAFVMGDDSINEFRPHKIMDYGIVMVAIQYRLGFFGFVSTGDLECPGNNGFKDQQFALRWVQANIHKFGGDPTKVTVSGQSAGAASVGYQLLGSNADGLFRGVIQASGSSLGTWSLQRNPRMYAFLVASFIDPTINEKNTTQQLMSFFRTLDAAQIKEACIQIFGEDRFVSFFNTFNGFVFSGVIEPEHSGAFLTEAAFKKFESGNFNVVPTMIGITSEEGNSFVNTPSYQDKLVEFDASPELLVTPSMHITDQKTKAEVGNYIRQIYVANGRMQDNFGPSIKYVSDGGFGKPCIKQAQLEAKYTDVYFYEFAYSGKLGRSRSHGEDIPVGADAVGHGEDISYLFPVNLDDDKNHSEKDVITVERLVLLWTNFVKYLNPTPAPSSVLQNVIWPKVSTSGRFPYLLINETIEVKYDLKKPMVTEYQRLYDTYAIPPLDTY